ncbi:TA system VapC family ribonuclease toxin [Garicola koreensis]|uniref:Ribonuclease VapC n=1 Tax=Garicola koreensis TaxID=1262554 RepID=A0A7W5TS78_9MICC|nr:TA system VapC family ribonuclease toxin [Garicola koreensis]MBB3666419.1 hypothetical protein [Garicola koreensis]
MKLVDANVLIYSVDGSAKHHESAKRWLDHALGSMETVLLPWVSLLAFVRIVTHPRIYDEPLQTSAALDIVELWLSSPAAHVPDDSRDVLGHLRTHLGSTGSGGNLVNDAYLAALARAHSAEIITFDSDFGRFPGVQWARP